MKRLLKLTVVLLIAVISFHPLAYGSSCKSALSTYSSDDSIVELREFLLSLGYSQEQLRQRIDARLISDSKFEDIVGSAIGDDDWELYKGLNESQIDGLIRNISSHYLAVMLSSITHWLKNVRGLEAKSFLSKVRRSSHFLHSGIAKQVLILLPLWYDESENTKNLVKDFYKSLDDLRYLSTLIDFLDDTQKVEAMEVALPVINHNYQGGEGLGLVHILPISKMGVWLRRVVSEESALKESPPVYVEGVQTQNFSCVGAGVCPQMTYGHLSTVFADSPESLNDRILISVNNTVIGSLKFTGNKSMLGLRNVVDSQGRLVVAMGGVYKLPYELVAEIINKRAEQSYRPFVLNFDSLGVMPLTYMLNDNSMEPYNVSLWLKILKGYISDQQMKDLLEGVVDVRSSEEIENFIELDYDMIRLDEYTRISIRLKMRSNIVRDVLLKRIEEFRLEAERNTSLN